MYMYIHSDYLTLGANKGNQNHHFGYEINYFIHTGHGPRTKTLQLILINYIV